jgi:hypothetical protein
MNASVAAPGDAEAVQALWRHFLANGTLPSTFQLVQSRLVRAVHRGNLPSGPVYVKSMCFPRAKDRLRYLPRSLPLAHEAAVLQHAAKRGILVPEVLASLGTRRFGLPCRSLLVLRALPVAAPPETPRQQLLDAAGVASQLLAAGIDAEDLHAGNFLRCQDGRLAVLDLQSASVRGRAFTAARHRLRAAARLLQELLPVELADLAALVASGLLRDAAEAAQAARQARVAAAQYWRGRLQRCLQDSTGFVSHWSWHGREHALRQPLPAGHWVALPRPREVWLGQRALQLWAGQPPVIPAVRRRWPGRGEGFQPAAMTTASWSTTVARARAAAAACRDFLAGRSAQPPTAAALLQTSD